MKCLLVSAVIVAIAQTANGEGCPPVSQTLVSKGSTIFNDAGTCFTCHGSYGIGTPLAPDLSTAHKWIQIDGSYDEIAKLVETGVPHPKEHPAPMPPMGGMNLNAEELCAVAAYVFSISHPAAAASR